MADCIIDWSPLSLDDWDQKFKTIRRSTLLQHYPYAQAARSVNHVGVRHGVIKIDGVEAGLVQMGEVGLFANAVHSVIIDRGPLWFDGFGEDDHIRAFFLELSEQFPKRFLRKYRALPEFEQSSTSKRIMFEAGFTQKEKYPGYQTIWLDITKDTETLRKNLNGKWRNILSKSERAGVECKEDWHGLTKDPFLKMYWQDRMKKKYAGPSLKFMIALLEHMTPRGDALIMNAVHDGDIIAAILILCHGSSATYQIGWTTPYGRDHGAHHNLLWNSVTALKNKGITDFDLGGINEDGAAGVKAFKEGLGGQKTTLAGFFT